MTDHLEKSAAAVMILVVGLEMLGQVVDPVGKDRDLYLGGTGVTLVGGVLFDNALFDFCCHDVFTS